MNFTGRPRMGLLDSQNLAVRLRQAMKLFCVMMAVAIASGAARPARAELADGIDAIIHDSIITFQEVRDATSTVADQIQRQYGGQPDVLDQKLNEAYKDNLERLLENKLILHDFDTAGYNLPESIIDEALDERVRTVYGDRVTLTKTLQAEGKTFEQFRREFRENFIVVQMRLKNVSGDLLIISPHKIETYYVDHKKDFNVEEQVKLRMIVLNKAPGTDPDQTRKLADEILTKIKEGASFEEMASVYSQGSQRAQGGDWGWVEKSVLRPELADVAFKLKAGEKSDVIETREACYLMSVEDKRPEHTKGLNEVRDEIEKTLLSQEHDRLQREWIDKLKKKTFIRTFLE